MSMLHEQLGNGGFIVSEANGTRSREQVTVTGTPGDHLAAGTVLALNASGHYVELAPEATDGTETAVAVLWGHVALTEDPERAVIIARAAEVNAGELVWPAGITDPQREAARLQLKAAGILLRAAL